MSATENQELVQAVLVEQDVDADVPVAETIHCETKADIAAERGDTPQDIDARLNELLGRIRDIAGPAAKSAPAPSTPEEAATAKPAAPAVKPCDDAFIPYEPRTMLDSQLTSSAVVGLALKLMLSRGDTTGREISEQIKLPFRLLDTLLREMKQDQLVVHKGAAPMNDYLYQLTDIGRERARRMAAHCSYFGAAPVSLSEYIASVKAQSLTKQNPGPDDLRRAFADLLINEKMLRRLGPAVNSGRGLFLYGAPGNGKTSIAERVTRSFGQTIWIPRAIGVDGEIIRLFDPNVHEEMPLEAGNGLLDEQAIDKRWVRVRRPTVVVGGELTMDNLEVTRNPSTGISEAPVQMKSNCGILVIDDFGRQRMSTDELLNRWIVPLEKRHDYLNLADGKKIEVPFDQLVIFSTNLEPKDLVDDAFLRRIPYKIEVMDPTLEEFRDLFRLMAPKVGFEFNEEVVNYLIDTHYLAVKRRMRCCQPRDLLMQMRNLCLFEKSPLVMSREIADFAVENYFAVL